MNRFSRVSVLFKLLIHLYLFISRNTILNIVLINEDMTASRIHAGFHNYGNLYNGTCSILIFNPED